MTFYFLLFWRSLRRPYKVNKTRSRDLIEFLLMYTVGSRLVFALVGSVLKFVAGIFWFSSVSDRCCLLPPVVWMACIWSISEAATLTADDCKNGDESESRRYPGQGGGGANVFWSTLSFCPVPSDDPTRQLYEATVAREMIPTSFHRQWRLPDFIDTQSRANCHTPH